MASLDHALALASQGFHLFPISSGTKIPPKGMRFKEAATRDPETLRKWFSDGEHDIGIYAGRFAEDEALVIVDVDVKKHDGYAELLRLELEGFELPDTRTHRSPSGGGHIFFRHPTPVKQGTHVIGKSLDIRSHGGYVVAYEGDDKPVAQAPAWLIERCGTARERGPQPDPTPPANVDQEAATQRAIHYLEHEAPLAVEGHGGDETTYRVAARLKDLGVNQDMAGSLMIIYWNLRCSPPWDEVDLTTKVRNAYTYGSQTPGINAPEAQFPTVVEQSAVPAHTEKQHPFDKLNADHAYVLAGGGDHILWETEDKDGRAKLEHLSLGAFNRKHAAWVMNAGKRDEKVTELWLSSTRRRSYDGMCFMPEQRAPDRFYNLWRGFAVQPLAPDEQPTKEMQDGLEKFLAHARSNVCKGDDLLYRWLIGYFAHLVQRPWEKPLVALVFRGGKGVGKNALIERIGALLGGHFLLTSNRRYLIGNFNGHLENCLLFALDEAFWSGDKQAEGQLKDLITGREHVIEHKGKEPFRVENKTRICIIGNEEWLVPSTSDERRFCVFDVGDGRKQDREYFASMREAMEAGGYRHLLRYLLDFDLTGLDFNDAPSTDALLDQKHATLDPFKQWWLDCLTEGRVLSGDFDTAWPSQVECERFRSAFRRYVKERNIRSRIPEDSAIGKTLRKIGGGLVTPSKARSGDGFVNVYKLPSLAEARGAWDRYIGHQVEWAD